MRRIQLPLLLVGICLCCPLIASQRKGVNPGPGWWSELRYRGPKGLGYEEGYGSLELFLSSTSMEQFHPFIDLQGHLFNDGKWAANGGFGFRYIGENRKSTYGANFYYDFRDGSSIHALHQIGAGLEYLRRFFEMRANGYLPIGGMTSTTPPCFSRFEGHNIIVTNTLGATLAHVDGEIGFPMPRIGPISFFVGGGGYYLFEKSVEGSTLGGAWGYKARAELGLYDGVLLGASVTNDPIFDSRAQGYIGLSIPLGPRNLRQGGKRFRSRYPGIFDAKAILFARLTQSVVRDEIIPIEHKGHDVGLLPCAGTCQAFFVDNRRAGGDGTFERPFPTLKEAEEASSPGDLLYILPGSGTPNGMDQGIVLKEGQRLIGSVASFSICDLCIPACTQGVFPVITNLSSPNAITLAEGVEVAGIEIEGPLPVGINTLSSGTFFLHNLFLHDFEGGIGVGSIEERAGSGSSPCGSKLLSDISIGASDGNAIGVALRPEGGAVLLRNVSMSDIGGTQAQIGFTGLGILTIENSLFTRQIVPGTSLETFFTQEASCFVFNENRVISQDIGLSASLGGAPNVHFQASCNQINSGMQAIFVQGVGKENVLLFDANKIDAAGRSIEIDTDLTAQSDSTKVCLTANESKGAFWLEVNKVSTAEFPVCLSLRGNKMNSYTLYNNMGSLVVESEDGTLSGVEALNSGGSVVAPAGSVGFVGIGSCGCACD